MNWQDRVERMSGPHRLANTYMMQQVTADFPNGFRRALDFGARESILPQLLAEASKGGRVVAVDRDPVVRQQERHGYAIESLMVPNVGALVEYAEKHAEEFNVVTACWSIQHNTLEDQKTIIGALSALLDCGGRLIIVGSLSDTGVTYHQANRADPQWVLSLADHVGLIARSGHGLDRPQYFYYEHGTPVGLVLQPGDFNERKPNAIAYTLQS